jgi:hypothetical protein
MAEQTYMGYVSPTTEGVDWAGLSSQLSTKLKTVETERQAERDALSKMAFDNETLVNSYVPGKDQTFNEMILRGADDARNKINYWTKELEAGRLNPRDFKTKQTNLKEYWGTLSNNAKNYDQRIADSLTRQQEGKAGALEAEILRNWTDATDVKSNSVVVGDDGRVYTSKFDKATGNPTGQVSDIRLLSIPENIQFDKIDLASQIENYTADWQPATMFAVDPNSENVELISESVMNQPDYDLMKKSVINAIAPDSNPRAQVSVLADNGALDVNFYYNDDEYDQKYNEMLSKLKEDKAILGEEVTQDDMDMIDLSLIKIGIDENDMYNPVLTDNQKNAVKEFISNNIDISSEDKITRRKSLEWEIGVKNKQLSLQEQRIAAAERAAARKAAAASAKVSKTAAEEKVIEDQFKGLFNQKTNTAIQALQPYMLSGYKLILSNGKYQVQKQVKITADATTKSGALIPGQMAWEDQYDKPFTDFALLSPYLDKSKAKGVVVEGSTTKIGGELNY